jgi:hypothetical protein
MNIDIRLIVISLTKKPKKNCVAGSFIIEVHIFVQTLDHTHVYDNQPE